MIKTGLVSFAIQILHKVCTAKDCPTNAAEAWITQNVSMFPVADSGGVRGMQMHPPLAASNVFLCT